MYDYFVRLQHLLVVSWHIFVFIRKRFPTIRQEMRIEEEEEVHGSRKPFVWHVLVSVSKIAQIVASMMNAMYKACFIVCSYVEKKELAVEMSNSAINIFCTTWPTTETGCANNFAHTKHEDKNCTSNYNWMEKFNNIFSRKTSHCLQHSVSCSSMTFKLGSLAYSMTVLNAVWKYFRLPPVLANSFKLIICNICLTLLN